MNPFHIRDYHPNDKTKVVAILKLNVPQYFAENEIADLEHYLDHEIEKYYVVELDNQIIGAGGINFEKNHTIGKISWDFLHPEFQGMGVGGALLQHRLTILKSMPEVATIMVRTSQLAHQFYEKNGFALEEIHKDFWAEGFDMHKMIYKK
ncbi:GNAT family N-acetyltransferase [Flavobacterium sp.]|uniref:GNAT family N-acetyltransferase n=1 Tax=Flavobacterium sp. TaxID=239 RepID=UPI0026130C2A|nr:GNAT family N-acetyltransferase [Flavobacterium sp.]